MTRFPQELVAYMRGPGKHKVMFGTNYPMLTPAECLAGVEALSLGDEVMPLFPPWKRTARIQVEGMTGVARPT